MLAPRWAFDPLSGAGAGRAGGRWNERGQAALYLSDSHATAIAEYQQDLHRPGTLTAYDVDASTILDLTAVATRRDLGLDDAFLRQPWKQARDIEHGRPTSWDFAASAVASGWQGLRVDVGASTGHEPRAVALERSRRCACAAPGSAERFAPMSNVLADPISVE